MGGVHALVGFRVLGVLGFSGFMVWRVYGFGRSDGRSVSANFL